MRVGILASDRTYEAARLSSSSVDHFSHSLERHEKTNLAVEAALTGAGNETVRVAVDGTLAARLGGVGVDLVFNTYFGPGSRLDQAYIASVMEYAGVAFTGGGAACHFCGLSKTLAKQAFLGAGIPTPPSFLVERIASPDALLRASGLEFPIIVKPLREGEGIGLDQRSVARSTADLAFAVERVLESLGQPALLEQFIAGRELTVGVLDGEPARVLPILELALGEERIYSYEAKVSGRARELCPAPLAPSAAALLGDLALRAGRSIGCRDYWRVDFRADREGRPFVLEVNTLPGLQPGYSDFPKMAEAAAMSYEALVLAILTSAMRRSPSRSGSS